MSSSARQTNERALSAKSAEKLKRLISFERQCNIELGKRNKSSNEKITKLENQLEALNSSVASASRLIMGIRLELNSVVVSHEQRMRMNDMFDEVRCSNIPLRVRRFITIF